MARPADLRFAALLRDLRARQGLSLRDLGRLTHRSKSHLHELESGLKSPTVDVAAQLDAALDAGGRLVALVQPPPSASLPDGDEVEAWELARRVEANDVGVETVDRIERAVDDLASAYPTTGSADLLVAVRRHLAYVPRLLDGRMSLETRRRLVIAGGWLSLLRATVHIDLQQRSAATAFLATADELAAHAEHAEIRAWCLETRAWDAVIRGDYPTALDLSQQAQDTAPRGSSAHLQAVAQEGRAWARMGDSRQTRATLGRLGRLVGSVAVPDRPEHHYRYDPGKAAAYTATTLAWAGDPAAVGYARSVLVDLDPHGDGGPRPRRSASARLDLALALLASRRPDEAAAVALVAVTSGRVVASNWWRATEVVRAVERSGVSAAGDLREAYEAFRP